MFESEQTLESGNMPEIANDKPIVFDDEKLIEEGISDESTDPSVVDESKDEDDKESYSRNVKKRIDKLTYQKNIAIEKTARLEAENQEIRRRLDEISKMQQDDLEKRNKSSQDQKRQDLIERKKIALEMGDYDDVIKIDDELFDLKINQQSQTNQQPRHEQPPQQQPTEQQQVYIPDAQQAWQEKNAWIYDANNPRSEAAKKIFADMVEKEGFDYADHETYDILDKRLKRQVPPTSGGPDRGQVTVAKTGVKFTSEDRIKMRDWGLDPENPAHRAEWLRNKSK
jgi:hypothetical protein